MKSNKIVELLNINLANLQILYVKLHNYHWNVKGKYFKPIHDMTEVYYNYFAEKYDEVAERIVQLGDNPLVTLKDYLANASLKEENEKEFDGKYILSAMVSDFKQLNKDVKEISKTAGESGDIPTAILADDLVAWLEKEIWILTATIG